MFQIEPTTYEGEPALRLEGELTIYSVAEARDQLGAELDRHPVLRLNLAAQVLNTFLLPLVITLLVVLAARALPGPQRLRGPYLWLVAGVSAAVIGVGLVSGASGMF